MSNKSSDWLTGILAQAVAAIAIVFWATVTIILAVIGSLVVAVVWMTAMAWEWLTNRAVPLGHDLFSLMRYLVTGYCGYGGCGHITLYRYWKHCRRCIRQDVCRYSGERVQLFVPEADCPIHDNDTRLSRWVQKMKKGEST